MTCFVVHRSSILIKIGSAFEVSNIHINIPSGTDNPPNIHFASHWRDNINVNTEIRKRILENHQKNMGDDIDRSQCLPKSYLYHCRQSKGLGFACKCHEYRHARIQIIFLAGILTRVDATIRLAWKLSSGHWICYFINIYYQKKFYCNLITSTFNTFIPCYRKHCIRLLRRKLTLIWGFWFCRPFQF